MSELDTKNPQESWIDYYKRIGKLPRLYNHYEPKFDPTKPQTNVCAKIISFNVEDDRIRKMTITGGCDGNTRGIGKLLEGLTVEDAIARLKGIRCSDKNTSCCDQISRSLLKWCKDNEKPTVEQQIEQVAEQVKKLEDTMEEKVDHLTDIALSMEKSFTKLVEVMSVRRIQ